LKIKESSVIMPLSDYSLMAQSNPKAGKNDMMEKYGGGKCPSIEECIVLNAI
jgi:hypothetical protein